MPKGNHKPNMSGLIPWKKGKSGNPSGGRRHRGFMDYLYEYFDEEVTVPGPGFGENGQKMITLKREEYFARMIGQAALASPDTALRRECIGIVINTLWPKPKELRPFIEINHHHDQRAIGFMDRLTAFADGAAITPDMITEALHLDAQGKLKDPVVSEASDEEQSQT